jgi:hypothetical protein
MPPPGFSSVSDVRTVWGSGLDGARLAACWMDTLIARIPHLAATAAAAAGVQNCTPEPLASPARHALAPTDPERYGWRFWALRPDGTLVTPFTGTEVTRGTFDAECPSCAHPPSPDCGCGVHYVLRARDCEPATSLLKPRTVRFCLPDIQRCNVFERVSGRPR